MEPWFSVTLSSINRRTEPVSRGKRQHLSKSTLRKLSTLFQAQIANDEDAFAEISNLQTKVKSRQDKIDRLREELGLPSDFKGYRLAPEHYPFILANCRSGSMKCNPRELSDHDVTQILEELSC